MTREEFQSQVERLRSVYGDRSYPDERVRLLWREVGNLDHRWFERTTDQLISGSRNAPLFSEFAPFISQERERIWQIEKEKQTVRGPVTAYSCEFCMDRGVYLCTLNLDRSVPYAFRCHCSKGNTDPRRQIPQYKKAHAEQGFSFYESTWARSG